MNPAAPPSKKVLLRKQYLNNLALEASNNQKNYDANKIFHVTGQLPLTPLDMTSVEQKYKDLDNLKAKVRGELMSITDGSNANAIADGISPLLLVFLANHMPFIIKEMKKKYALGVQAPVFINYLKQLHKDSEKKELDEYGNGSDTDSDIDTDARIQPINLNPILQTPVKSTKSASSNVIPPEIKSPSKELEAVIKEQGGVAGFKAYLKQNGINEVKNNDGKTLSIDECTKTGKNRFNTTNVLSLYRSIAKGKGIRGKGLKSASSASGIPKSSSYVPFGRYTVNVYKLNDDILMMKTPKAGAIPNIPTTKISSSLCSIVKTLLNKQIVEFETISKLNDDDKRLLHKVATKSHIHVSVPSPDKDKQQQEMDRFNILRGEIIAGNDNKGLIKEFKVMLMKFMNNGTIPRRQALDILTDITALGL